MKTYVKVLKNANQLLLYRKMLLKGFNLKMSKQGVRDFILSKSIEEKKLFYEGETISQIGELKGLLNEENFKNIKEFALNQIEISKDDDPDYWFRKANEVEEPTMANFIQKSDEIRAKYRDDLLASVNYNRETLEKKRKNLETAVSFYIRFEDDIKDIRD